MLHEVLILHLDLGTQIGTNNRLNISRLIYKLILPFLRKTEK